MYSEESEYNLYIFLSLFMLIINQKQQFFLIILSVDCLTILQYRTAYRDISQLNIMSKIQNNILLQRSELGKIKTGFHDLPQESHVYGKAPIKDKYCAKEVVSEWSEHKISKVKELGKNFVAMNKEGVKNGCIDSKQITNFRKGNEIKIKSKQGQKFYGISIPNYEFVYGIPNRPSTPIKNVICNTYGEHELQLKRQKEAVVCQFRKDNPSPPKIQAKKAGKESTKKKSVEDNNFKLAKFKHVQSKIQPLINANTNQNK